MGQKTFEAGYRAGVEAAANLCDDDSDQHLRGLFRNRKILAQEIRSLSPPAPPEHKEVKP